MTGRKESLYYERARHLFTREFKLPKEIATILPVSENTLYKWRDKGGWIDEKKAFMANPGDMAKDLKNDLEEQYRLVKSDKGLNAANIDGLYKILLMIEKLEKIQDPRDESLKVMQAYGEHLRGLDITTGELQMHGDRMRGFLRTLE